MCLPTWYTIGFALEPAHLVYHCSYSSALCSMGYCGVYHVGVYHMVKVVVVSIADAIGYIPEDL